MRYYKVKETGEIFSSIELTQISALKTEDGYIAEKNSEVYMYELNGSVISVEAVKVRDFMFTYHKLYKELDNCIAAAKEYKKELNSVEIVNTVK